MKGKIMTDEKILLKSFSCKILEKLSQVKKFGKTKKQYIDYLIENYLDRILINLQHTKIDVDFEIVNYKKN